MNRLSEILLNQTRTVASDGQTPEACEAASKSALPRHSVTERDNQSISTSLVESDPSYGRAASLRPPLSPPCETSCQAAALFNAQVQANLCERFLHLTQVEHHTTTAAAKLLGRSPATFSGANSILARYLRGGIAALLPPTRQGLNASELTQAIQSLGWFVPAAKFFYLSTNYQADRGSVPEAIRRTISLPALPIGWTNATRAKLLAAIHSHLSDPSTLNPQPSTFPECPRDIREAILARQTAGKPLVPETIARQITATRTLVHFARSPRAWSLDTLSAPGSQRRYFNAHTGQREIMQPGDWFGGDDATPGIAVVVPCHSNLQSGTDNLQSGTDNGQCGTHMPAVLTPCSQRYGVLLGRFQWLVYHDARTDKILGWDYVVRPRGSYRAEDVVHGIGAVTRAHGIPRKGWQLEGGTFHAKLVQQCIRLLGCEHWRTYSPHQKAIESIFNRAWTRLAVQFPQADMGRYRAENEANCAIYEACKAGHKDPRHYFPDIATVLQAFADEVAAHNAKPIRSEQYGTWIPDQLFTQSIGQAPLRPFAEDMAWIFSPFSVERKIRGMMVRCRVPMFEDFSVPYEFHADWMPIHNGKLVRLHFDPRTPQCRAKIVLLEESGTTKAGTILGDAQLIGETTGYIRTIMGWAEDDQRSGYIARQRTAHFMRRETRALGHGGRAYAASETRSGLGQVTKAELLSNPADGVPNAGNANNRLQAGTGEPPASAQSAIIPGSATEVNAPLPQSLSRGGVGTTPDQDLAARLERASQLEQKYALDFL
jgi:hypothetical protein